MLLGLLLTAAAVVAQPPAASTEAFKFDYLRVKDRIEADGHARRAIEVSVLLRTPGAVQQFGQIGSPYVDGYGAVSFENIRVQKGSGAWSDVKDGQLEDLNPFGINDASIPVDIRYKKLTIPRLEPGDRLSYALVTTTKPFVPGEAYGEMKFTPVPVDGPQVYDLDIPAKSRLSVTLRADLGVDWEVLPGPADRLVRRLTATIPPTVVASTGLTEAQMNGLQTPDVSFTTFSSWSNVAAWWWDMSRGQVRGDDATKRETGRIVAGRKTPREKIEAIASFVSSSVRYLSVGFGIGRMQPRPAASVLTSRYGDCKDKVGLVMAMAAAAGIEVRPVLIHSQRNDLQDEAPGPHQFDHMIAAAVLGPDEKDWLWIDPTNSLASPLTLLPTTRDKRALVIEPTGQGAIVRTPAVPPHPSRQTVTLTGTLETSGVLKGKLRVEERSDNEPAMRTAFASVSSEQHAELLKASYVRLWKDARIKAVRTADPVDIAAPFWLEFEFERDVSGMDSEKEWKLWIPDLGPILAEASTDATAKKVVLFDVGEVTFNATVELPENVTARAPLSITLDRPFASLASRYSVTGRTLAVSRSLKLPTPFLERAQVPAYEALRKAADTDREQNFMIGPVRAAAPAAATLQKEGKAAYTKKEYAKAIELLQKALEADPKLAEANIDLGLALRQSEKFEDAIAAYTKAIELDPYHDTVYAERAYALFELNRDEEAEKDLLKQIEVAPFKDWSYGRLAQLRDRQGRYLDAAELYTKALAIDGNDVSRWLDAGWAYARGGKPEESRRAYEKAKSLGLKEGNGVRAAFGYRRIGDIKAAGGLAQEDLAGVAKNVALITPQNMSSSYLYWVRRLAQAWMIIGEAALEARDIAAAEKFLKAAWEFAFLPDAAFALGRIREEQGRPANALELWSAAATLSNWETRPRDLADRIAKLRGTQSVNDGSQEMARLRFIKIPGGSAVDAQAEVLILASAGKVTGATNVSKANEKEIAPVLTRLIGQPLSIPSPDGAPQTLLRTGTLACTTRAGCQFIARIESGRRDAAFDFGEIQITRMSPESKSTFTVGETVRLTVSASYHLEGTDPGEITLVVGTGPTDILVKPQPRRAVQPGRGTVEFDVTFTVPVGAKEVRVFLPLSAKKGPTNTVATAHFPVKP